MSELCVLSEDELEFRFFTHDKRLDVTGDDCENWFYTALPKEEAEELRDFLLKHYPVDKRNE